MLVHVCLFSYNLSLQQQIENRMVIKYFYLTILFVFSLSIAWSQNSENLDFSSPEERILFNKKNGFEKYSGVLIEYVYIIEEGYSVSDESATSFFTNAFKNYIDVSFYKDGENSKMSVLTKGKIENHNIAFNLEREFEFRVSLSKRKYHLQ